MKYTFDNIGQWVEELAEKPKITQFHTYARVVRDQERQEAECAILEKANSGYMHGNKEVTIINDDMAIIAYAKYGEETRYMPVVKDKPAVYWFTTFEGAMLGAISLLKSGDVRAATYAAKVLEVDV